MWLNKMLLGILLSLSSCFLYAQTYKDTTHLHKFFRNNFDSTIIFNQWSSWYPYPTYYIIAKKDSAVFFFTYKSPYAKIMGRSYPSDLMNKFIQEHAKFISTVPDTNRYFLPVSIRQDSRSSAWSQINSFGIWKIKEIKESDSSCEVYDDVSDTYHLITRKDIKTKLFYAADFYEKCKPGNQSLISEIKTRNVLMAIFGN